MEGRVYPFIDNTIYKSKKLVSKSLLSTRYQKKGIKYFIWARDSIITPFFLRRRIAVHSGNKFSSFIVRPFMIGHKFGEFAITKRIGAAIHIKKVTKKKKKGSAKKK